MLLHLLVKVGDIGFPNLFIYGAFLFLSVYSYSSMMDNENEAFIVEVIRTLVGFLILYFFNDWFFLTDILPLGNVLLAVFLLASLFAAYYFTFIQKNTNKTVLYEA